MTNDEARRQGGVPTSPARILSGRNTAGVGIITRSLHSMTHDVVEED